MLDKLKKDCFIKLELKPCKIKTEIDGIIFKIQEPLHSNQTVIQIYVIFFHHFCSLFYISLKLCRIFLKCLS